MAYIVPMHVKPKFKKKKQKNKQIYLLTYLCDIEAYLNFWKCQP